MGVLAVVVVARGVSGILERCRGSLVGLGSFPDVRSQTSTTSLLAIPHDRAFRLSPAPLHVVMRARFDPLLTLPICISSFQVFSLLSILSELLFSESLRVSTVFSEPEPECTPALHTRAH